MAGYSETPLPRKLGIKSGHCVALVQEPEGLEDAMGPLPHGVTLHAGLRGTTPFDVVLLFARSRTQLERRFAAAASRILPEGGLWIAWPKRASGVASDLTGDVVRALGLSLGLVDVKVCAIDATWSALRFVWRRERREGAGRKALGRLARRRRS